MIRRRLEVLTLRHRLRSTERHIRDILSYPDRHPEANILVAMLREKARRYRDRLERMCSTRG